MNLPILTLLLSTSLVTSLSKCLTRERIMIGLSSEGKETKRGVKRQMALFSKTTYPIEIEFTTIRISYESIFCSAQLDITDFSKCVSTKLVSPIHSSTLRKHKESRQCLIGAPCEKDICFGRKESLCTSPQLSQWVEAGLHGDANPLRSWVHHTCNNQWKCEFFDEVVKTKLVNETHLRVERSAIDFCDMPLSGEYCVTQQGWTMAPAHKIEFTHKRAQLPCLTGETVTVCFDEEEGHEIVISSGTSTISINTIYSVESEIILKRTGEPSFLPGLASTEDLEHVYRVLQYENLQSLFNIQNQINRLGKMELLVSSLINFLYGTSSGPLESLLNVTGSSIKGNGTHILTASCKEENTLSFDGELPMDEFTKVVELFSHNDFSSEQYQDFHFQINSLDPSQLLKLQGRPVQTETVIETSTGFWDGFSLNVLAPLYRFCVSATTPLCVLNTVLLLRQR